MGGAAQPPCIATLAAQTPPLVVLDAARAPSYRPAPPDAGEDAHATIVAPSSETAGAKPVTAVWKAATGALQTKAPAEERDTMPAAAQPMTVMYAPPAEFAVGSPATTHGEVGV